MKTITKLGLLLVAVTTLFMTTSCKEEFQVEASQLVGMWQFPDTMTPDTVTGFNWAGAILNVRNLDTITVNKEAGKYYVWTLRDNNVTAIATPRPTVPESWVIAFTVHDITNTTMTITGKCRYIYENTNTVQGDISCTLKKYGAK